MLGCLSMPSSRGRAVVVFRAEHQTGASLGPLSANYASAVRISEAQTDAHRASLSGPHLQQGRMRDEERPLTVTTKLSKADVTERAVAFGLSAGEIAKLKFLATRDGVTLRIYSGRGPTDAIVRFLKSLAPAAPAPPRS